MRAYPSIKTIAVSVFVITLTIYLSGCADFLFGNAIVSSARTKEINQGSIQLAPPPSSNTSKSVITLTREDVYAQHSVNYIVTQNNKIIGLLKPGSYLQWEVELGKVTVSYKPKKAKICYTSNEPCITQIDDIINSEANYPLREFNFNVSGGEHYYLRLEPDWFLFHDVPRNAEIIFIHDMDLLNLKSPHRL